MSWAGVPLSKALQPRCSLGVGESVRVHDCVFGERLDANSFHQLVAPSALTWCFAAESLLVDLGSPSNQRQVTGDPAAPLPTPPPRLGRLIRTASGVISGAFRDDVCTSGGRWVIAGEPSPGILQRCPRQRRSSLRRLCRNG